MAHIALSWLRLLRIPNHATAVADVLAGYLICSGPRPVGWPMPACWAVIVVSLALYAAGMVLNDVFDVELDREERPERPLPSGAIGVGTALAVGYGLLAVGVAAAVAAAWLAASPWPAVIGGMLGGGVWAYDRHAKATVFGPAVMGGCRSLNWLLGMTAAGGPVGVEWLVPLGMGLFVAGITLFARHEAERSRPGSLVAATLVMVAGLTVAGTWPWLAAQMRSGDHWNVGGTWLTASRLPTWLLLWAILCGSIVARAVAAIADPTPRRVQRAVGNAIMSIITLDAALVLAACGESWAVIVLALLAPFVVGRRLVSPT
jgi:4-hydroxybenzoate polyprenyltransferase